MNITDTMAGRDLQAPRAAVTGQVFVAGEARYDQARQGWNLAVDTRPAVVVTAESAAGVAQAVRYARAHGMRIAPQGTGYGAEPALSAHLAVTEALLPVAERHGVTPAAVAVAWTLAFTHVIGAIVGARSPRQVDGWLPAATLELKDDDLSDIAAVGATGAGSGPASPSTAIR